MKRSFAVVMAAALLLAFVSCDKKNQAAAPSAPVEQVKYTPKFNSIVLTENLYKFDEKGQMAWFCTIIPGTSVKVYADSMGEPELLKDVERTNGKKGNFYHVSYLDEEKYGLNDLYVPEYGFAPKAEPGKINGDSVFFYVKPSLAGVGKKYSITDDSGLFVAIYDDISDEEAAGCEEDVDKFYKVMVLYPNGSVDNKFVKKSVVETMTANGGFHINSLISKRLKQLVGDVDDLVVSTLEQMSAGNAGEENEVYYDEEW